MSRLLRAELDRLVTRPSHWVLAGLLFAVAGGSIGPSLAQPARTVDLLLLLCVALAGVGYLAGAVWVGAELAGGGMAELLLWRPGRVAVLGAKLAVLLGGVLAVAVATTGGYLAVVVAAGVPPPGPETVDLVWLAVRGVALAGFAAGLGFAVTTLTGRTATALAATAGYLAVWEAGLRWYLVASGYEQRYERWFLLSHVEGWLTGETLHGTPAAFSGVVLGSVLLAGLVAATATFIRRDLA